MSRATAVAPSGVERTFSPDEIIVTKTDLKGRIIYANDVFLRVSAFEEREVIGQPHSMIRHPEMPRAVFKLLWDELAAKRELFAYVCNLAGDGAHYWVFAHVTASTRLDGSVAGYHSSRRVPPRRAVVEAERLYRTVRAVERRYSVATEAARAGFEALATALTEEGVSYDEWVWSLATEGLSAR